MRIRMVRIKSKNDNDNDKIINNISKNDEYHQNDKKNNSHN